MGIIRSIQGTTSKQAQAGPAGRPYLGPGQQAGPAASSLGPHPLALGSCGVGEGDGRMHCVVVLALGGPGMRSLI